MNRSFIAVADNVAAARALVGSWLCVSMPDEALMAANVALALSEACTNVVVHAYPSGNPDGASFHVHAHRAGDSVFVTVSDTGGGMVPRPDSPGLGLGLPLIASLTDAVEMGPPPQGSGTVVAMRFGPPLDEVRSGA